MERFKNACAILNRLVNVMPYIAYYYYMHNTYRKVKSYNFKLYFLLIQMLDILWSIQPYLIYFVYSEVTSLGTYRYILYTYTAM